MHNSKLWTASKVSLFRVLIGLPLNLIMIVLVAYPLSKSEQAFPARKYYVAFMLVVMLFNGGMMPTYLIVRDTGLLNTMWALILPGAMGVYNMIVARTYYQGIPRDLREAADVDGASELVYFFQILLPVCAPIIATLAMWQFVGMWNSYFDAMVYLNDAAKQPLQLVLRSILIQNQPEAGMVADMQSTAQRAQLA
jgi:putative aldouronate transport system permease protein